MKLFLLLALTASAHASTIQDRCVVLPEAKTPAHPSPKLMEAYRVWNSIHGAPPPAKLRKLEIGPCEPIEPLPAEAGGMLDAPAVDLVTFVQPTSIFTPETPTLAPDDPHHATWGYWLAGGAVLATVLCIEFCGGDTRNPPEIETPPLGGTSPIGPATPIAPTPEPNPLALVGTGILFIIGAKKLVAILNAC